MDFKRHHKYVSLACTRTHTHITRMHIFYWIVCPYSPLKTVAAYNRAHIITGPPVKGTHARTHNQGIQRVPVGVCVCVCMRAGQ